MPSSLCRRWAKDGKACVKHDGKRRTSLDDFIVDTDEEEDDSGSETDGSGGEEDALPSRRMEEEDVPIEWLGDGASLHSELTRELERRGADASCKSAFVLALIDRLTAEGHRTLIFSQSKAGVKAARLKYLRIDGDVSAEDRQAHVQTFQRSNDIPVFLLTSQVGGLGLTLTAADRVIIVDPAWNPSVDNQSVDRAYRIGQTRDVVVYRLITCGTVEEKIYRKQVFKGGLSKTGTEEGIQFRYFTQTDLRDLFSVTPEGLQQSATQVQLNDLHAHQRSCTEELQRHMDSVLRMDGVAGIHDHHLLFTQRPQEPVPTAQDGAAILSQMQPNPGSVDTLTSMLGSGLRLGGGGIANTKRQAAVDQARRRVEELASRIQHMQSTAIMAARMPDGGAKSYRAPPFSEKGMMGQAPLPPGRLGGLTFGAGIMQRRAASGGGNGSTNSTAVTGTGNTSAATSMGARPQVVPGGPRISAGGPSAGESGFGSSSQRPSGQPSHGGRGAVQLATSRGRELSDGSASRQTALSQRSLPKQEESVSFVTADSVATQDGNDADEATSRVIDLVTP
ncbi:hypothetical protein GPECTOR_1g681 [Gonium pectorale]|uniref:Helicase C-terminal domain-containing protein n=1 Tax=Gonium pectorale TaxID=33097 RepID=A0A150H3M5_GONPE|nr:hypothetical protein GPECTOR_1g681 [Gonium pectorale]|eukprot:KXZ56756.1 hypothetical protein GPECTOR_1g681 [Gonium pectorale]